MTESVHELAVIVSAVVDDSQYRAFPLERRMRKISRKYADRLQMLARPYCPGRAVDSTVGSNGSGALSLVGVASGLLVAGR